MAVLAHTVRAPLRLLTGTYSTKYARQKKRLSEIAYVHFIDFRFGVSRVCLLMITTQRKLKIKQYCLNKLCVTDSHCISTPNLRTVERHYFVTH